jgi:hypothetical protein
MSSTSNENNNNNNKNDQSTRPEFFDHTNIVQYADCIKFNKSKVSGKNEYAGCYAQFEPNGEQSEVCIKFEAYTRFGVNAGKEDPKEEKKKEPSYGVMFPLQKNTHLQVIADTLDSCAKRALTTHKKSYYEGDEAELPDEVIITKYTSCSRKAKNPKSTETFGKNFKWKCTEPSKTLGGGTQYYIRDDNDEDTPVNRSDVENKPGYVTIVGHVSMLNFSLKTTVVTQVDLYILKPSSVVKNNMLMKHVNLKGKKPLEQQPQPQPSAPTINVTNQDNTTALSSVQSSSASSPNADSDVNDNNINNDPLAITRVQKSHDFI